MLKKFGEAADVTAIRDAGFQWVLEDYTIDQVTAAFKAYLKTGKEIPTPADIVEILDPSVKPLCPRVYQSFVNRSKKGPFELTREEKAYIDHYENQQLGRIRA
ncbi:hypothetical protein [Dyadobacter sp. CY356]|uniref:hypothetical protein n=1 Tax=Dyadobacter sp. CY356 TaxID=2906442 RepID=UPI001F1EBCDF|nr:hypothetical protein [Dyadobacter sp. CY356]MCF0055539.1 hypothetical protein [Dyadobacter sp. CY356]